MSRRIVSTMSRATAAASRVPGLRDEACIGAEERDGRIVFFRAPGMGSTDEIDEAHVYTIGNIIDRFDNRAVVIRFRVSEPGEPPETKKCDAGLKLGFPILELVKSSPQNPTVRAMVMAKVGQMPPAEADDGDKIIKWVEENFYFMPPPPPPANPVHVFDPANFGAAVAAVGYTAPVPPPPTEAFRFTVESDDVEKGTCKFVRHRKATSHIPIPQDLINDLINDDLQFDEMIEALQDELRERHSEFESEDSVYHEAEGTCDHEVSDSDGVDLNYSTENLKRALGAYLRTVLSETELSNLGL